MRVLEAAREQDTHDSLTSLQNRAAFDEQIARITDLDFLVDHGAFLFMMDIDHLKWVNAHGHLCGDEVIRRVAGTPRGAAPPRMARAEAAGDLASARPAG